MVILAAVLLAVGGALLRYGLLESRRRGVFRTVFWQTFRQYAGYRRRELLGLGWSVIGAGMILAAAALLYRSLIGYYAARFGRPL